jgi:broad specificity phosphatase PhoE
VPTLYLIRHGKASPGTDDYDQLHALGARQAELLGEHFARDAVRFDAVYVGPLKRQQDTWQHLLRGAGELARAWPAPRPLPGLTEAPYEELARHMVLTRLGHDVELTRLLEAVRDAGTDKALLRPLLVQVMQHMNALWHRGELEVEGLESAAGFRARIDAALQQMLREQPGDRRVAAITSNGVIGGMLELVAPSGADVPPLPMFRNASVSVIEASVSGARVVARDLTAHLPEPELLTVI